jgi:membrane-bound lytic murein transglycosylase B
MRLQRFILIVCCLGVMGNPLFGFGQTTGADDLTKMAQQQDLQNQLKELQSQINDIQNQLKQTTSEKNTLANKVKTLKKQQDILNLQIKATDLQVGELGGQISETENLIVFNTGKTQDLKNQIASVIRAIDQSDQRPFIYVAVGTGKLSDVFNAYQEYAKISQGLSAVVSELNKANADLETQKHNLAQKQEDAENLLTIKVLQQSQLSGTVSDQNNLLAQVKGKEADYQITLNDTKARASEISGRIYQLIGISGQVTFGEAYKLAQWASGATGVDAAFLLAVLTQESNLGKNVGTCNRLGDGPEKSYKAVMKPTRDIEPFLAITQGLGMNPDITPVSCAMKDKNGKQLGWGGAMGPAQFIPSTWMGYKDKVSALTGNYPSNPWDIRDAFAAAGILLKNNGADGTTQGNWNAAMRYFSGGTNKAYSFYGDNVLALAAKYQTDINSLGN